MIVGRTWMTKGVLCCVPIFILGACTKSANVVAPTAPVQEEVLKSWCQRVSNEVRRLEERLCENGQWTERVCGEAAGADDETQAMRQRVLESLLTVESLLMGEEERVARDSERLERSFTSHSFH
jgi:hypothetical protein